MADQNLEAIVQRMIDAGESEENIATVIQSFGKVAPTGDVVAPTPVAATTPEVLGLIPMPDEIGPEVSVADSGRMLEPGTASMIGAGLATGGLNVTEPLRRGLREGARMTAAGATRVMPWASGLGGSAIGAGVGAGLGATVGAPFQGATIGATMGGAAGHFMKAPVERVGRIVEGALDTKPLGTLHAPGVADKVADYAAAPKLKTAARLASQAVEEKNLGLEAPARETARRASQARSAAAVVSKGAYNKTRGLRGIADAVFGKMGPGGKLGISKVLPAVGTALAAYDLYGIGKDLYDRQQAGEDVPASEVALDAGLGILGLLPGLGAASKAARTSKAARLAEEALGLKKANAAQKAAREALQGGVKVTGRATGAGPAGTKTIQEEARDLEREIMGSSSKNAGQDLSNPRVQALEKERRALERRMRDPKNLERSTATEAVAKGEGPSGGRRGVTGGSSARPPANPPNLSRATATEAVKAGEGPSGGARGVTGASRARSVADPKNLVREPKNLTELMKQAEAEGLNPDAVAHRIGEWMRARGITVEGATLPRPKK